MSEPLPPEEMTESGAPILAQWLGYAGLTPFIAGAVQLWLIPTGPLSEFMEEALLTYAAVILSFMGAVHWGLAMRSHVDIANMQLGLSVVPALIGWTTLMLPALYAYPVFMVAFLVLLAFDLEATRAHLAPRWYPSLRIPLTIGVVASLGVAYAELLLR